MKSGLLVQSITSTVRCITGSRHRSMLFRSSSAFAQFHTTSAHCKARNPLDASTVFGLTCLASFSATSLAICSSSDNGLGTSASAEKRKLPRDIMDPLHTPEHHSSCPFPEEALRHDTYQGVTLNISKLLDNSSDRDQLSDPKVFQEDLEKALQIWESQSRRGIWLRIPTTHSHLIPSATSLGFDFRHAEPGHCVLTKWLPAEQESRLPNGPSHQVGVGVLLVHPITGKMLVVREKSGPAAARKLWKMPTGLTDPGEDIAHAAIRELKEETGLDCTFDHIICFRQAHGGLFNKSDMFFVCLCKLSSKYDKLLEEGKDIELLPQEEEILCADWIDMEDYAKQKVWKESPLYREMNGAMIRAARRGIEYSDHCKLVAKNLPVGFRPGTNTIYVNSKL